MFTEDSNTGFLGSLRSLFSSKKLVDQESDHTESEETQELVREQYKPQRNSSYLNMPTDRPMGTRTVDYSHIDEPANHEPSETAAHADEPVVSPDLDILFASMLIEKGGKFVYCESIQDAVAEVKLLAKDQNWQHVFCWENEIKDAFCEADFQRGAIGYTLENSDAAMCLCESLVADSGNLILNPKQASRRRLPVFPRVQIFLADVSQIAADLNKSVDHFNMHNKGELPSILDLHDNVKGHYYHDGNLVLKAEGPSDIYVFLVDEKIPPSVRP